MPDKQKRGFAAMDPEKLREISRKGGQTSQAKGTAHKLTQDESEWGGYVSSHLLLEKYGTEHFSEMGKLGGRGKWKSRKGKKKRGAKARKKEVKT